jgi:hypothetical protein
MVTVEYQVDPAETDRFLAALTRFSRQRRRDGAYDWMVLEDSAHEGRWVECFLIDSWLEHLRQHERVTEADRADQDLMRRFHKGDAPPRVRHLIAPGAPQRTDLKGREAGHGAV